MPEALGGKRVHHSHAGAHIIAAHVLHALQEDEDAARHMAEARRIGYEIGNSFGVWMSYLTEAYFHLERNDDAAAIAPLRKGLQAGRETGFFGSSLRLKGLFEKVSAKALEEGIEVDYVKELIRRNRLAPDPANPDLEQWPWPVKVYTLGRFGLLVDDRPVEYGRKVQQKPLALLKAVVALGGREVSEAKLTEFLWPEADGDLAHHSFEVALSRLRKLLGNEEALVLKEGHLSLSNRHCWVDVWAFARFLGRRRRRGKRGRGRRRSASTRRRSLFTQGPSFHPRKWPALHLRGRSCGADSSVGSYASVSVTRTGSGGGMRSPATGKASKRTTWPRSCTAGSWSVNPAGAGGRSSLRLSALPEDVVVGSRRGSLHRDAGHRGLARPLPGMIPSRHAPGQGKPLPKVFRKVSQ